MRINARRVVLLTPPALLLLSLPLIHGCEPSEPLSPPSELPPSFEIVDALHATGNPDFFFLPPLVPDPAGSEWFDEGAFDAGLSPVVEICQLGELGCVEGPLVASFTMEGSGETPAIQVSEADEQYHVNWHLSEFALDTNLTYRIRVLLGDNELGHADVDLVSSGSELKSVDTGQFIPLKDGRTLPVKFRLEESVGSHVGPAGGTVVGEDGAWSLQVPAGGLTSSVEITATPVSAPEGALPGTTREFGPEGTEFDPPALLTLRYDPDDLASGKYPRLHRLVGENWVPAEGSVADLAEGTVTAPVSGFSIWAVLGTDVYLDLYVVGGVGEVKIDGWTPPAGTPPCDQAYPDPPCTAVFPNEAEVTLMAEETGFPDGRFEEWIGDVGDFDCPVDEKECTFTMMGDRSVTARFSMPGLISVSATSATFEMPYGGTASPSTEEITVFLSYGRPVTLEPIEPVYSPSVDPWLDTELGSTYVEVGSPATLTLSILPNSLPVGEYTANVPVTDGYYRLWIIDVTLTVTGTEVTVNGAGRHFGPLPVVPYAFADAATATDIYPLGTGAFYLFGLFDTGSTRVRLYSELPYFFNGYPTMDPNLGLTSNVPNRITDANWFDSDAGLLGITTTETVLVRLNGLGAIDPDALTAPIGPPGDASGAQFETTGVEARLQAGLDVTLLGAPVAEQLVAVIDHTQAVVREGYDFYPGLTDPAHSGIPGFEMVNAVAGPEITFYPPEDPDIPAVGLHLQLARFGFPERWTLNGLEFRNDGAVVTDHPEAATPSLFLFDTGTTPTIIGDMIAGELGLTPGTGSFNCLGGVANGFTIDEVVVTGVEGTYVVQNPSVCVSEASVTTILTAVIGSNLFDQVPLVFDGPGNTLGIGTPTSTPVIW